MEKTKELTRTLYEHSLVRYGVIGGSTFILDFSLLVLLHAEFHIPVLVAATASYWISIIFNFAANRLWTFGVTETHIAKHAAAYGILLCINYLFTISFIATAASVGIHYTIAKVLAVIIQMSWTYIVYKKYVFR